MKLVFNGAHTKKHTIREKWVVCAKQTRGKTEMSRKSQIQYYGNNGRYGYYTNFQGNLRKLASGEDDRPDGENYQKAMEAYKNLFRQPGTVDSGLTLATLVPMFLEQLATKKKPNTVLFRRKYLEPIAKHFGKKPIASLREYDIEQYCQQRRKGSTVRKVFRVWTDSSVRNLITSVNACFNWAAGSKVKLIAENPIDGMEKPKAKTRGKECLVGNELHKMILEQSSKYLRPILIILEATGARASEVLAFDNEHFNRELGAIVFKAGNKEGFSHKTSETTDKDRVIYLTGEALELITTLADKHSTGSLFKTRLGTDYTYKVVMEAFVVLQKRFDMPKLTAMSYRHTYATEWIKQGLPVEELAVVLGTSVKMIHATYSHLFTEHEHLREKVQEFRKGR